MTTITPEVLHSMKLMDKVESNDKLVERVPGGWNYFYKEYGTSVHVPYTKEGRPKPIKQGELFDKPQSTEIDKFIEYWNTFGIVKCKTTTAVLERAYKLARIKYGKENIAQSIKNYSEVLRSEYYFNTKWNIEKFLRQANALPEFMNDGVKWINYKESDEYNTQKNNIVVEYSNGIKSATKEEIVAMLGSEPLYDMNISKGYMYVTYNGNIKKISGQDGDRYIIHDGNKIKL